MFVLHKCFHRDLTEENTSWFVLWPQEFTQHIPMQSDVDSWSPWGSCPFASLPPFLACFCNFLLLHSCFFSLCSPSFPHVSHIWRLTAYRHFPKYPACYYYNNTEGKGMNHKIVGRSRKNLVCITWEHRTQNNAGVFISKEEL